MGLLEFAPERRIGSGARVRQKLIDLTGTSAPYPEGQRALAQAVNEVIVSRVKSGSQPPDGNSQRTMTDEKPISLAQKLGPKRRAARP